MSHADDYTPDETIESLKDLGLFSIKLEFDIDPYGNPVVEWQWEGNQKQKGVISGWGKDLTIAGAFESIFEDFMDCDDDCDCDDEDEDDD